MSLMGKPRVCSCSPALARFISVMKKDGDFVEIGDRSHVIREISSSFWDVLASGTVALIETEYSPALLQCQNQQNHKKETEGHVF